MGARLSSTPPGGCPASTSPAPPGWTPASRPGWTADPGAGDVERVRQRQRDQPLAVAAAVRSGAGRSGARPRRTAASWSGEKLPPRPSRRSRLSAISFSRRTCSDCFQYHVQNSRKTRKHQQGHAPRDVQSHPRPERRTQTAPTNCNWFSCPDDDRPQARLRTPSYALVRPRTGLFAPLRRSPHRDHERHRNETAPRRPLRQRRRRAPGALGRRLGAGAGRADLRAAAAPGWRRADRRRRQRRPPGSASRSTWPSSTSSASPPGSWTGRSGTGTATG